ncbi:probable chitinase 10 [Anopheles marshallii]|uniref:probable chitinase 10 n=1 Tax=Anopheles marshallii TaxID=1521116 RepID=UPI00237B9640|nr:probable chitinase 10 [Anopheles marshallii]
MNMIALLLFSILGMAYGTDTITWSMVGDCTIDARCPSIDNSLQPTFLAQATNCNKFYQCSYGKACELTCPTGLHWSVQLKRCEWPNVACCDPSVACLPSYPTAPTNPVPIPTPTTMVPPGNNAPNPTQCVADARCPLDDNPNNPTLLPHETNCGLFYACSYGRRCPLQCKAGEHFSVQLQRCDWAQFTCCDPTIPCQQLPSTPVVPTELPLTDCHPDTRCPYGDDPMKPLLLPAPGNCGAFYKCRRGDACLLPCPAGQHFSQAMQVCEWPQVACCDPTVACVRSPLLELLSLQK